MAPLGVRVTPLAVLLLAAALGLAHAKRKGPPPPLPAVVQALKPQGLRISFLDEKGMDLVIINANINAPLGSKETGQITKTVLGPQAGYWTLENSSQQLKQDDVVFYRIYFSIRGEDRSFAGRHIISELVDPSCRPSITTVNGQPACRGALIFEDNFETFNRTAWKHNIQFYGEVDVEFTTYVADEENSYVKDGNMCLKPTVVSDEAVLTTPQKLEGCTSVRGGEYCERRPFSWNIIPPTRSAWLSSTMGFRFGRVEIRAKTAIGDWIESGAFLEPRDHAYGKVVFQSGRIVFMRVRGSPHIQKADGSEHHGANHNRGLIGLSDCNLVFFYHWQYLLQKGLFSDSFHTFAVTWTPHGVIYETDGKEVHRTQPRRPNGFNGGDAYGNCENSRWDKGTFMAPYDKEFTVNLAVFVAGYHSVADGAKSGNNEKPYRDRNPQAAFHFWKAHDSWLPTWKQDLQIDYVKVWAL